MVRINADARRHGKLREEETEVDIKLFPVCVRPVYGRKNLLPGGGDLWTQEAHVDRGGLSVGQRCRLQTDCLRNLLDRSRTRGTVLATFAVARNCAVSIVA
jgi:hypothetical protein